MTRRVGRRELEEVRLDELETAVREIHQGTPVARPREHRGVDVDGPDLVTCGCQRDGEPATPGGKLEDRAVRAVGQGEVEIEVVRIVAEVEVIQPGEFPCSRRIGGFDHPAAGSQRTGRPAALRTASALIASSAARLATIAVVSA